MPDLTIGTPPGHRIDMRPGAYAKAATEYAKASRTSGEGTQAGSWVSSEELGRYFNILTTGNEGRRLTPAQAYAALRDFEGARFTMRDGAMKRFQATIYDALGIQPPPNPWDPPAVALYSVAIEDAMASGDLERMVAISELAHSSLNAFTDRNGNVLPASRMGRHDRAVLSAGAMNEPSANIRSAEDFVGNLVGKLNRLDDMIKEMVQ